MKVCASFGLAAALLLVAVSSARAGFQTIQTSIVNGGDTYAIPDVDAGALGITAPASNLGGFDLWGTIDSDPLMTITESITNNTLAPWDSYTVTLTPIGPYTVSDLAPNPSFFSNDFTTTSLSPSGLSLTFTGGLVNVHDTLIIAFQFNVADIDGTFDYHVSNAPHLASGSTPEPATLAMVGLGVAGLLRRRRR